MLGIHESEPTKDSKDEMAELRALIALRGRQRLLGRMMDRVGMKGAEEANGKDTFMRGRNWLVRDEGAKQSKK